MMQNTEIFNMHTTHKHAYMHENEQGTDSTEEAKENFTESETLDLEI